MFWRLSSSQRSLAVRHIKRIHSVSLAASVQNDAAPTAFVARFAQKTLRALSTESRAPSPAPHIIPDHNEDSSFQIDLVSRPERPKIDVSGRIPPVRKLDTRHDPARRTILVSVRSSLGTDSRWSLLAPAMGETALESIFGTGVGEPSA